MKEIYETDWLASKPVFYNEKTNKVSYNINDVIDINNLEFHPEGLKNYLDFGYAVLGQTPVRHVKFLRHSSRITVKDDGKLHIEHLEDPVISWLGRTSHEDDVLDLLKTIVNKWENSIDGEIIIPTSGGFDSRLLNYLISDKSRIRSFTYGISNKQSDSIEVVFARQLSNILGTKWAWIPLGDYNIYFDVWERLFGISSHAEGMYHIEFYSKILPLVGSNRPLLSGIIGDVWAGSWQLPPVENPSEVVNLSRSYGVNADSKFCLLKTKSNELLEQYFESRKKELELPIYRVVEAVRFKIIMLCYLIKVPEYLTYRPWSPFLLPEIALSMLTLPPERRQNRLWQREYFKKCGLDLEDMNLKFDRRNTLDRMSLERVVPMPLDKDIMGELFDVRYIEKINQLISDKSIFQSIRFKMLNTPKIGAALREWMGFKDKKLKAYNEYLCLKSIENLLKRRGN